MVKDSTGSQPSPDGSRKNLVATVAQYLLFSRNYGLVTRNLTGVNEVEILKYNSLDFVHAVCIRDVMKCNIM